MPTADGHGKRLIYELLEFSATHFMRRRFPDLAHAFPDSELRYESIIDNPTVCKLDNAAAIRGVLLGVRHLYNRRSAHV